MGVKYTRSTVKAMKSIAGSDIGFCAICGNKSKLHVDHSHTTGLIRGLLCIPCNQGLGRFSDNIERLFKAALYIRKAEVGTEVVDREEVLDAFEFFISCYKLRKIKRE